MLGGIIFNVSDSFCSTIYQLISNHLLSKHLKSQGVGIDEAYYRKFKNSHNHKSQMFKSEFTKLWYAAEVQTFLHVLAFLLSHTDIHMNGREGSTKTSVKASFGGVPE